jgi:hypothetical protein
MQQPMFHYGLAHLDSIGQQEYPLELPRSDTSVQIHPIRCFICLTAKNNQLAIFNGD